MTPAPRATQSDEENDRAAPGHRHRRAELRARLAAERALLLSSLLGMRVDVLECRPLQGTTSAAGMLNAVAARERSFAAALTPPSTGSARGVHPTTGAVPPLTGFDEALARCIGARTEFLDAFARIPDAIVFGDPVESAQVLSPLEMATQCYWSDASLSLRASTWNRDDTTVASIGPISLLRASMRAARKDFLTTVALVPDEARELAVFDGGRTLPQIFRLIVDLERSFLGSLAGAGLVPAPVEVGSLEAGSDTWQATWSHLHAIHAALVRALDVLEPSALAVTIGDDDSRESVYMWAWGCLLHDRLNGARIRAVLELDWPERLLR